MDEKYMNIALKEAAKAYKKGDVPVGAVIVEEGKIIAKGYNKKESKKIATKHAEIVAIEKACKKKKSWYLDNCTLYVTMEPCIMCCGAILQSRIKKVIYATCNEKFGGVESIEKIFENNKNNHRVEIEKGICQNDASKIIKKFFKEQRKS
jgi:tRNA(adenine34) deaminase